MIADLDDKLGRLSRHIDDQWPELDRANLKLWGRLVTVYSQNCVRLGELKQIRQALSEDLDSDELDDAINAALDQLSDEWGIEL